VQLPVRGVTRETVAIVAIGVVPWCWFLLRNQLGTSAIS
jgi:hypothetical protein